MEEDRTGVVVERTKFHSNGHCITFLQVVALSQRDQQYYARRLWFAAMVHLCVVCDCNNFVGCIARTSLGINCRFILSAGVAQYTDKLHATNNIGRSRKNFTKCPTVSIDITFYILQAVGFVAVPIAGLLHVICEFTSQLKNRFVHELSFVSKFRNEYSRMDESLDQMLRIGGVRSSWLLHCSIGHCPPFGRRCYEMSPA